MTSFTRFTLPVLGFVFRGDSRVSRASARPGDLVLVDRLGRVGLYVGNGRFIQAPHTVGAVQVTRLSDSWYRQHLDGARRSTRRWFAARRIRTELQRARVDRLARRDGGAIAEGSLGRS